MRFLLPLACAAILAAPPGGVAAQDMLAPLRNVVEDLLPSERPAPQPAPPPRPAGQAAPAKPATDAPPLPRPRPDRTNETEVGADDEDAAGKPEKAVDARIYQTACPALIMGLVEGEMLPPITEGRCGERSPLSITAVSANGRMVPLSSPVTTNCAMAGALADWVREVDAYARAALDSPLAVVKAGTGMMCRNRYGAEGGFMSEHGFANALDVPGFTLENGASIDVEDNWLPASAPKGRLLRQAHGAACGRFTTVLGPEANADHKDHLHLDLGCHGKTCTAQICE